MKEIKFLSFAEWLRVNPDIEVEEETRCDVCKGEGEIMCRCGECGDEHFIDCKECSGKGKTDNRFVLYQEQLKRDKRAWSQLTEKTV